MRISSSVAGFVLALTAFMLPGCGGGGGSGGGGGPPSLFPAGVTAQDLVAAAYEDRATDIPFLVLADVYGRGQATITGFDTPVFQIQGLRWSPDHSLLAVIADPDIVAVAGAMLYVVEPLTGGVRLVSGPQPTDDYVAPNFKWSPDGSQLAFQRDNRTGRPVFTVNADGTNLVEVSAPIVAGGKARSFDWSLDSSRLALRMDAETAGTFEVFVVAPDGSGRVKVSGAGSVATGITGEVVWSPDSSRMAYMGSFDESGVQELFVSLASGVGGRLQIHPPLGTGGDLFDFAWAPDGSRIAYRARLDAADVGELFTSRPDGTGNVRVSGSLPVGGDVESSGFVWSPDSSRIAYVADQTTDDVLELFTVVPDGSAAAVKVSGTMVAGGDVGGRSFNAAREVVWSPDSARIAFVADQEADDEEAVYVTSPAFASSIRVSAGSAPGDEALSALLWSDDSRRLAFQILHDSGFPRTETFVAFLTPFQFVAVLLSEGELNWTNSSDVLTFARDRLVLDFRLFGSGDKTLRSYDFATLDESIVLVPPPASEQRHVDIR